MINLGEYFVVDIGMDLLMDLGIGRAPARVGHQDIGVDLGCSLLKSAYSAHEPMAILGVSYMRHE